MHLHDIFILVIAFIASTMLSLFSIPNIIFVAKKKRLFDIPDNDRKIHKRIIPNLGGVGIFFSYMMVASLFINQAQSSIWNYIATATLLLFITGLKDDLVSVSPFKKFVAQLAAGFIVVYFGHIQITNLYGLLGVYELPVYISVPFTIIGITFVTNALNLIDGVDGLAGAVSLIASGIFGVLLYASGNMGMSILAFSLMGGIAGFLYFNRSPAKIFMGDTGSLLLGFTLSILGIAFINSYDSSTALASFIKPNGGALVLALAILFIPIFDTFRVFTTRIFRRNSPFSADKTHLHHYLLDAGCTHNQVVLFLVGGNFFIIVCALALQYANINLAFLGLLVVGLAMVGILLHLRKQKELGNAAALLSSDNGINGGSVPHAFNNTAAGISSKTNGLSEQEKVAVTH